jgi:hypothetical protein
VGEEIKRMTPWQRIKSAAGWGLFLGICDWVLASGITNKIPREGVWAIVLAQVLLGLLVVVIHWAGPWYVKGLVLGIGVNLPLVLCLKQFGTGWGGSLFWPLLATGIVIGLFIEWVMRKKA